MSCYCTQFNAAAAGRSGALSRPLARPPLFLLTAVSGARARRRVLRAGAAARRRTETHLHAALGAGLGLGHEEGIPLPTKGTPRRISGE